MGLFEEVELIIPPAAAAAGAAETIDYYNYIYTLLFTFKCLYFL